MPLDYATRGGVKRRQGITDTNDDALIDDIVADVNLDVEDMTGRAVGPSTVSGELLDGFDALEDGRCLLYPKGIRSVTLLEVASGTGESFSTVPAADIFLRPTTHLRQPGWPAFEIWMTDVPSASNTLPVFLPGFANIRLGADISWAAIPSTLTSAAETTAARTFLYRAGWHVEGSEQVGTRSYRALWSDLDLRTVRRYTLKSVEIDG